MAHSSTVLEKPDHKERKTGLGQLENRTNVAIDFTAGEKTKPNLDLTVTLVRTQNGHASQIKETPTHQPSKNKNRDQTGSDLKAREKGGATKTTRKQVHFWTNIQTSLQVLKLEVTILPSSFNYWKQKSSSWHTHPNLGNANAN
jgi:hypothetical protein